MAILKKLRSATLMEALVATVLIIVVFIMASVVLNNLLLNTFSKNTHDVEFRMNELNYLMQNNHLTIPYNETYKNWEITIESRTDTIGTVTITAENLTGDKTVTKTRSYEK